jgi:hypothetical protein
VKFLDEANLIQFWMRQWYVFDRAASWGDVASTMVTVPDLALPVVKMNLDPLTPWWADLAGDTLAAASGTQLFTRLSVEALLFNMTSPILLFLNAHVAPTVTTISLENNDTSQAACKRRMGGPNIVWSGRNDSANINLLHQWQGQVEMTIWGGQYENLITGTDGRSFSPNLKASEDVTVFLEEGYRHFLFSYRHDLDFKGIALNQYELVPGQLDNTVSSSNPLGAPYWLTDPSGMENFTAPLKEKMNAFVPILSCQPYFMDADASYADAITFLPPQTQYNRSLHTTYLGIEPVRRFDIVFPQVFTRLDHRNRPVRPQASSDELSAPEHAAPLPLHPKCDARACSMAGGERGCECGCDCDVQGEHSLGFAAPEDPRPHLPRHWRPPLHCRSRFVPLRVDAARRRVRGSKADRRGAGRAAAPLWQRGQRRLQHPDLARV